MAAKTDRLKMPLLAAAQAQKEVTHNEALALVDIALQSVVVSIAPLEVPIAPTIGQCWIVGTAPTGAWAGQAGAIACWTSGGWRFLSPFEGMQVWSLSNNMIARRTATAWVSGAVTAASVSIADQQVLGPRRAKLTAPVGGTTIDVQARATLNALIAGLEAHGLFSAT